MSGYIKVMVLRLRVWMPLVAALAVLLSIALMFAYGVPAVRARLADYALDRAFVRAATTADAVSEAERRNWPQTLALAAGDVNGEVFIIGGEGEVVVREGGDLLGARPPEEVVRAAAEGERMTREVGSLNLAVVPLNYEGEVFGGLVFATESGEEPVYGIFLRGGLEAAAISLISVGGLMLLLATLLSRRVERLAHGARAIEEGNLSHRIVPGYNDELGELAAAFNAMAEKLEGSFGRIKESNDTRRAVLQNLTEGVLATDLEGRVIFSNPAAEGMLGAKAGMDRVPDPWKDFDLPKAVARCAREEECGEARVRGRETFFRIRLAHMPHFDEHKGGVLVVVQDLSEGRRVEAEQQRFLANAAHELKTPITAILGASELLLTEEEDDPETRRRFLEHIHAESRRMQRLSDALLRLARTGQRRGEPDTKTLDLGEEARRAAAHMEPLAGSAGLEIVLEGRGGRVRADSDRLEQALLVLLGNAINHSEKGRTIRLRAEGNTVAVEDEGAGISKEDLPHVFERFYRGRGETGGFGMGLSICKELVEGMGGDIAIESRKGAGTTVKIKLPEVEGA